MTQSYFKTFLRGSRGRRSQPPKSIRTSFNFAVGVLEESGEVSVATSTENCRDFWSPRPFLTPAARSSSSGLPHHTFGSAGPAHALLFFLHTPNFNSTCFFKALDETPFLNDRSVTSFFPKAGYQNDIYLISIPSVYLPFAGRKAAPGRFGGCPRPSSDRLGIQARACLSPKQALSALLCPAKPLVLEEGQRQSGRGLKGHLH